MNKKIMKPHANTTMARVKIAEEIGDLERQMKYLVNLGLLYRDQEDWQKAMELYNQVLNIGTTNWKSLSFSHRTN